MDVFLTFVSCIKHHTDKSFNTRTEYVNKLSGNLMELLNHQSFILILEYSSTIPKPNNLEQMYDHIYLQFLSGYSFCGELLAVPQQWEKCPSFHICLRFILVGPSGYMLTGVH